jgi:multimeric flavodoxin WrbA
MDSEPPTVVGIAGSIRNRAGLEAVEGVDETVSGETLLDEIRGLEDRDIYHDEFLGEIKPRIQALAQSDTQVITNSDALVLTALYGAKGTADVEFHKLTDYVGLDQSYADTHIDSRDFAPLVDVLERADGIILGSPVYFGDRSSLVHSFINFAAERDLLQDMVVGTVSCGSKRNGGQETTNIYALFENLTHGAIIVGNGPKTCQYGGTGWGGDIGDVATDDFGLETSMGTGLRISSVAQTVAASRSITEREADQETPDPFKVGVLVTRENDGYLQATLQQKIDEIDVEGVEFNVIDFTQAFIQACIGCDVCPTPGKVEEITDEGQDYKCIIDEDLDADRWSEDDLQDLHHQLMANDALVVAAMDTGDDGIADVYQALLERTRYIRRDDWRLHNVPLAAYVVKTPGRPSTFPIKIMTSWMRHNTIVHPPIVHTTFDLDADAPIDQTTAAELETYYNQKSTDRLERFVESARRISAASNLLGPDTLSYKATGYRNKILDQTTAKRT